MNTTLANTLSMEKEAIGFEINEWVQSASEVIVPLEPVNIFAARSPWAAMEHQSFEQVARLLKDTCDVNIYPNDSILQSARERGEIDPEFVKIKLQQWLDSQSLHMPREAAEQYCRSALMLDQPSQTQLDPYELKSMAKKLNHYKYQIAQKDVIHTYSKRLEQQGGEKMAEELNRFIIKWCKLYLDESQAAWSMPNREEGFYTAWRKLVPFDPALKSTARKHLNLLPKEAEQALINALIGLEIPYFKIQDYLKAHLLALPGWAGMMLWRSQQSTKEATLLTQYLAVRISLEWVLMKPYLPLTEPKKEEVVLEPLLAKWFYWGNFSIREWSKLPSTEIKARLLLAYQFDEILSNRLWLEAWEATYEEQLKKTLFAKKQMAKEKVKPVLAQFVFCIDVRSEPFRRKLEQSGPFQTFGTAGFFGLPIKACELGTHHSHNSLPVMFEPLFQIRESSPEEALIQYQQRLQVSQSLSNTFKKMKHNLLTSLLLPEISGPWLSLHTLARSFVPRSVGNSFRKIRESWLNKPSTRLTLDHEHGSSNSELPVGFTDKEKVFYVKQALKMMGLTENFAPLVVICGHGSHSTNNVYTSALDCGACGGASSGFNARVLAALCNLPSVRQSLALEGISIPKDTVFVAAEHITTLDDLQWIYVPDLSDPAKEAFIRIQEEMPKIRERANAKRLSQLPLIGSPKKNPKHKSLRLAEDWSEVRPEWGLARNAAFIIGERTLTQKCDLEGRVFLHNYNWQKDKNGAILATIISGPATVAQWINLQYYASTVAPHYYGSGNKTTQTVTSGVGVMQGNESDLLSGLPWQSVMQSDHDFYHAPIRLLVVIQSPREYIERLLLRDSTFLKRVRNGWIRLASIDQDGNWESW